MKSPLIGFSSSLFFFFFDSLFCHPLTHTLFDFEYSSLSPPSQSPEHFLGFCYTLPLSSPPPAPAASSARAPQQAVKYHGGA
jgi:hypothetical protein